MNTKTCGRMIEECFPEFRVEKITTTQQGWDSFVIEVNGTYIFRFPTRQRVEKQLKIEIKILPKLAKRLPVPIPEFKFIWLGTQNQPQMFVGYQKIIGSALSIKPPFDPKKKRKLAQILGQALSELHSFPIEKAVASGMKPATADTWKGDYLNMLKRHQKNSFPMMEPELQRRCIELFDEYLGNDEYFNFEPVITHGDLAPDEHILWNAETEEITGIIDWGDVALGDPALDFTGILCDCGPEFTNLVLEEYDKRNDSTILDRAEWYMKLFGFHNIEYGQLINDQTYVQKGLQQLREL